MVHGIYWDCWVLFWVAGKIKGTNGVLEIKGVVLQIIWSCGTAYGMWLIQTTHPTCFMVGTCYFQKSSKCFHLKESSSSSLGFVLGFYNILKTFFVTKLLIMVVFYDWLASCLNML